MLLVPEIETVILLVPRTGSTALKNAIKQRYPNTIQLYRHMEADGVPRGYDRWRKVGVVRNPWDRLWSLYKYCRDAKQEPNWVPGYAERLNASVERSFDDWLLNNSLVFTDPYVSGGGIPGYWPRYAVSHPIPETRKSQFIYLRPDLGTEIWPYYQIRRLALSLGVVLKTENETDASEIQWVSPEAISHIHRCFEWDLKVTNTQKA